MPDYPQQHYQKPGGFQGRWNTAPIYVLNCLSKTYWFVCVVWRYWSNALSAGSDYSTREVSSEAQQQQLWTWGLHGYCGVVAWRYCKAQHLSVLSLPTSQMFPPQRPLGNQKKVLSGKVLTKCSFLAVFPWHTYFSSDKIIICYLPKTVPSEISGRSK